MDSHISIEEFKDIQSKTKPSKHRNVRTEYGGRIYDSKKEAEHAAYLEKQRIAGYIKAWIPQVSLPLTSSRYVVDFVVIHNDGLWTLIDIKGWDKKQNKFRDTPMSILKRKELFDLYGLEVILR